MSRIDVSNGEWVCRCGNYPAAEGFDTCLPDGTLVEPDIGGPWAGHYRCLRCDLVLFDDNGGKGPRVMGNAANSYLTI